MQFWKEFFETFKNGNFFKHLLMAASSDLSFEFSFCQPTTLFKKFDQCIPKAFIKNWSVCRLD